MKGIRQMCTKDCAQYLYVLLSTMSDRDKKMCASRMLRNISVFLLYYWA